jgi:hypothetical protein
MLQQARKPLQQHPFAVCTFPWRLPSLFLRLTSFSGMAWHGRKRQQHHAATTCHTQRHVLTRPFFLLPPLAISTFEL